MLPTMASAKGPQLSPASQLVEVAGAQVMCPVPIRAALEGAGPLACLEQVFGHAAIISGGTDRVEPLGWVVDGGRVVAGERRRVW
jgi:hypothetical protein